MSNIQLVSESITYYNSFKAQAFNKPVGVDVIDHWFWADYNGELQPSSEIESYHFFSFNDYKGLPYTAPAVLLIFESLLLDKNLI